MDAVNSLLFFQQCTVLFAVLLVVVSLVWQSRKSDELLQNWALGNGYKILQQQRRLMARGPFFWNSGRGHAVFRVMVEDQAGFTRNGWVRFGGWWVGLMSNKVEVRWDDDIS